MRNNTKMIVTDLDKTLLNNNGNITEYTKETLRKCMERDIIVVFATARPIRVTNIFYPIIRPNAIICHNGAEVLVNDKVIHQCGISAEIYNGILDKLARQLPDHNLAIEINDKLYANFNPAVYWGKIDYEDITKLPDGNADKIVIGIKDLGKLNEIEKQLSEDLYLEKSQGLIDSNIGLIMNKGATKWNALKELAKYFNVDIENIVSFGDNENDLEMVRNSGTGVAVENGIDEIKRAAKYVCESNENNGVAVWIENNIL
jgi:Cof subfamily protein (haloacid dehalogenase superfamily)